MRPKEGMSRLATAEMVYAFCQLEGYIQDFPNIAVLAFRTSVMGGTIRVSWLENDEMKERVFEASETFYGSDGVARQVIVPRGSDVTITMTPDESYVFAYIKEAGQKVTDEFLEKDGGQYSYTLSNVQGSKNLEVHFALPMTYEFINQAKSFKDHNGNAPKTIPLYIFEQMFLAGEDARYKIYSNFNKETNWNFSGYCYGMVVSTMLETMRDVDSAPPNWGKTGTNFKIPYELTPTTITNKNILIMDGDEGRRAATLTEFIQCAQVSAAKETLGRARLMNEISARTQAHYETTENWLDAISKYEEKGKDPVMLIVGFRYGADAPEDDAHKEIWHSVFPYRVEWSDELSGARVYCYDPNQPNNGDCYIQFTKVDTSHELRWEWDCSQIADIFGKEGCTSNNPDAYMQLLTYDEIVKAYSDILTPASAHYYYAVPEAMAGTLTNSLGETVTFEANGIRENNAANIITAPVIPTATGEASYPQMLYTDEHTVTYTAKPDSKLDALLARCSDVHVMAGYGASATLTVNDENVGQNGATISSTPGDQIAVVLEFYYTTGSEFARIEVNGTMTTADATVQKTPGGVLVEGLRDVSYLLFWEDGRSHKTSTRMSNTLDFEGKETYIDGEPPQIVRTAQKEPLCRKY